MRRLISSGSPFEAAIGYSRAVVDGDYVFVSGTTGYDYTNMTIQDDVISQAGQCFANIATVLEQAGSSFADVVRIRYIFTDRDDFEPCWPVFSRYLGESRPAATLIIAALMKPEMKLEVEVTARVSAA